MFNQTNARHCEEACKADAAIQSQSSHDNCGTGLLRHFVPRNDDRSS